MRATPAPLMIVTLILSFGCADQPSPARRAESVGNASVLPARVQYLTTERDSVAVELWETMANTPSSPAPRRQLALHYERGGYATLAVFVRGTADLIESGTIPVLRKAHDVAWACPPHDAGIYARIARADELLDEGRFADAVDRVSDVPRTDRPACPLFLSWAYVVLNNVAAGSAMSAADTELAIRVAITGGEEIGFERDGKLAHTYDLLASHFVTSGDIPSAIVAAQQSVRRTPSDEAPYAKSQREQRLATLQERWRRERATSRSE